MSDDAPHMDDDAALGVLRKHIVGWDALTDVGRSLLMSGFRLGYRIAREECQAEKERNIAAWEDAIRPKHPPPER